MQDQAARIRSYFDTCAGEYARAREREFSFATQKRLALEMLPARLGRVLDVGCGPAVLAEALLERAEEFWGIDLSAQMIAHGRARVQSHALCTRCHLGVGDGEALGFADGAFDAVVSLGMLEYLSSYDRALAEIFRVLRPGGVAVLAVPNRASAYHRAGRVTTRLRSLVKRALRRPPRASERFVTNRCVRRSTVSTLPAPMRSPVSKRCRSSMPFTGCPANRTIRSPACTPARLAGPPFSTDSTRTARALSSSKCRARRRASGRLAPARPRKPRRTLPSFRSCSTTHFTVSIAVAKQMPCAPGMIAVLTPITSPCESTSGPPELPGLSAASVCSTSSISRPVCARRLRPSALTTPAVTVCWKP